MKVKKATAVILCAAMTASVCACNSNKKSASEIEKVLKEYEAAIQETDGDAVLDLASWDEGDDDYANIEQLFEDANYTIDMESFKGYIASTIKVNFDSEDIEIEGDKASVKVTYELVDWEKEYFSVSRDPDDLLDKLKDSDDTAKIRGRIKLEKVDGEWKITDITNLGDVFFFCFSYPLIDQNPSIDNTVTTVPNETDFDDYFNAAIAAYIELLESEEIRTGIKNIEDNYTHLYPCGSYDIDKDGIPELYFIAGDDTPTHNGSLYIYDYDEYAGKAVCVVEVPNVCYQAGDGGSVLLYTIPGGFVIQTATGGEMDWHVNTCAYDLDWFVIEELQYDEEIVFDGDDYDSMRIENSYYSNEETITEEEYSVSLLSYINSANVMLANHYYITAGSNEAPLLDLPEVTLQSYDEALNELYSLL